MGLLSKVFGGRPAEAVVTHAVGDAVRVLPGVTGHTITYNHQQYQGGALSGVVDVADSPTFLEVLRTSRGILGEVLGADADRVVFYLSGRTPDGAAVQPGDLGLSQPPSGREVADRLT